MSWKKKIKKYCAISLVGDYLSTENNSQVLGHTNGFLILLQFYGQRQKVLWKKLFVWLSWKWMFFSCCKYKSAFKIIESVLCHWSIFHIMKTYSVIFTQNILLYKITLFITIEFYFKTSFFWEWSMLTKI